MPYTDPVVKKAKQKIYSKKWSDAHRERKRADYARYYADPVKRERIRANSRNAHLVRKYGITAADYDRMHKNQKGKCLICDKKKPLVVDHCHDTGVVRGLLCHFCNRWLGLYESWKAQGHFEVYLLRFTNGQA